jgi:hypothetical protein
MVISLPLGFRPPSGRTPGPELSTHRSQEDFSGREPAGIFETERMELKKTEKTATGGATAIMSPPPALSRHFT